MMLDEYIQRQIDAALAQLPPPPAGYHYVPKMGDVVVHDPDRNEWSYDMMISLEAEESEDERIRKGLLQVFSNRQKYCADETFGDLKVSDILAWLEKRKEQRYTKEEVLEELRKDLCNNDIYRVPEWLRVVLLMAKENGKKEAEWKDRPANWNEEKEAKYQHEMSYIPKPEKPADLPPGFYFITLDGKKYYSKEFRMGDMKMKVVENEQKPVEWSEEDERIFKGIYGKIDHGQSYNVSKVDMLAWLKSLRPLIKKHTGGGQNL